LFGRSICAVILDYQWWQEMGQLSVWFRMGWYHYGTGFAEWAVVFVVLWIAHARGMKHAGTGLREHPFYGRIATIALLAVSGIIAAGSMSGWVVARYFAGGGLETAWHDPVFGRPLSFYFFELPFYTQLTGFITVMFFAGALVYYAAARFWQV